LLKIRSETVEAVGASQCKQHDRAARFAMLQGRVENCNPSS
jgi:hypothetical protein